MALTPSQVLTAVSIGKYGGCLPACSGSIITGTFNLAGAKAFVAVTTGYVAGSYPLAPGEIHNLYRPVEQQPGWWIRRDDIDPFAKPKRLVHVRVMLNDDEYESWLLMSDKKANAAIKVVNFLNTSQQRVRATIKGFKHLKTTATVQVKNFVKKWWS
jgi:hypothetical protein